MKRAHCEIWQDLASLWTQLAQACFMRNSEKGGRTRCKGGVKDGGKERWRHTVE